MLGYITNMFDALEVIHCMHKFTNVLLKLIQYVLNLKLMAKFWRSYDADMLKQ